MGEKRHAVLIADDYEADRFLLKEVIRRHAPKLQVIAEVEDGEHVLAYLSGEGEYSNRQNYPLPDVLVLDIRMPRLTGLDVLEQINKQNFPNLKIAVLTDPSAWMYRSRAMELGAKYFFSKALDTDDLILLVRRLQEELENDQKG